MGRDQAQARPKGALAVKERLLLDEKLLALQFKLLEENEVRREGGVQAFDPYLLPVTNPWILGYSFVLQPVSEEDLRECLAWMQPQHYKAVLEERYMTVSEHGHHGLMGAWSGRVRPWDHTRSAVLHRVCAASRDVHGVSRLD
jgi:hypothetical protein